MTHAERALARFLNRHGGCPWGLSDVRHFIDLLDAIQETRDVQDSCTTPGAVRRVPQPLTPKESAQFVYPIEYDNLTIAGYGIYRISEVEEACK